MIAALLARASTRFVFVVGKGGVGKTTTAGALALALAERGSRTHLISTDPAHSLADLFGCRLEPGTPAGPLCAVELYIEEFDAQQYAQRLFETLRPPLSELIERGTWLDGADASGFLDLSIPGIEEVMSALRLAELRAAPAQRIIVDTAPTGHTLRLLEAAATIHSWVAAGRAMANKAAVVATHLVGRRVPLAAEPHLEALAERAADFEDLVQRDSSALVVTRAGRVVEAETDRLVAILRANRMPVAAVLTVGGGSRGDYEAAWLPDAVGCDALRAWAGQVRAPTAMPPRPSAPRPARAGGVAEWIRSSATDLIFVAGKGGVGKSTCAAALALALAEDRRVCIVGTDPAGSLGDVFACDIGVAAREVAPRLFARQIDAAAGFRDLRTRYEAGVHAVFASVGLDVAARLDREVVESLWNFAPPGLDEMIAVSDIVAQRESYDTLVIDTAPTGHFLRLIELPETALAWVRQLLRLLVKYGAAGSLDALAGDLLAFAKRLRQLKLDLSEPSRASAFVVTLEAALVAAETARLQHALARAGLPVAATILNRAASNTPPAHPGAVPRTIRAPLMPEEIVGPAALRVFLGHWES